MALRSVAAAAALRSVAAVAAVFCTSSLELWGFCFLHCLQGRNMEPAVQGTHWLELVGVMTQRRPLPPSPRYSLRAAKAAGGFITTWTPTP